MGISHTDYLAMQARVNKTAPEQTDPLGTDDESELHGQIAKHCKDNGWICWHGSMAHRTRRVEGEPDFIILADSGRVFLIECKTGTGKLSVEQNAAIHWAGLLGHTIHVVRSYGDFLDVVNRNPQHSRHD